MVEKCSPGKRRAPDKDGNAAADAARVSPVEHELLDLAIMWFRRDLRLADNPALAATARMAKRVLPVYIWSPEEEGQFQPGTSSRWWLAASLATLAADLAALGSRLLLLRASDSGAALCELCRDTGARAVAFNHLYDPVSMCRDAEARAALAALGVACHPLPADLLCQPWEVLRADGRPFSDFASFWEAHRRCLVDRAKGDRPSTSHLSPHLHYGEVSARQVFAAAVGAGEARRAPDSLHAFLRQLAFREYGRYLAFHYPFTLDQPMLGHLQAMPWHYDAWKRGQTGYPVVDASMRQLWSTGWIHHRGRVVCASFLVKNLLLPWQWGLKHFWDTLIDADLESDSLGWQYCAGCLRDGHALSHMVDLAEEAARYDPGGAHVRRWIPTLARLPNSHIHSPWTASPDLLAAAGIQLGEDYPFPVLDMPSMRSTLDAAAKAMDEAAAEEAAAEGGRRPSQGPFRPSTRRPDLTTCSALPAFAGAQHSIGTVMNSLDNQASFSVTVDSSDGVATELGAATAGCQLSDGTQ
ncbi:Cryptochrome-1 [Auxenochlorella protothecoides]|uniref:Cryptochrome-1 n=1 Tax=Auxenochlorella protothecoides TaxID=3075 RepID=A0A087SLJ0_AUXPR|nr:Cryptochrome-1 [Auxenochlorella protothecoides]KFM26594.1 Cryptochrome-1 [Auxenochlorella protothecoides]